LRRFWRTAGTHGGERRLVCELARTRSMCRTTCACTTFAHTRHEGATEGHYQHSAGAHGSERRLAGACLLTCCASAPPCMVLRQGSSVGVCVCLHTCRRLALHSVYGAETGLICESVCVSACTPADAWLCVPWPRGGDHWSGWSWGARRGGQPAQGGILALPEAAAAAAAAALRGAP